MSARHILSITGNAANRLLRLTHEASGVLPLKSIAGDALLIADLVKNFHTSKKEWRVFGAYVQDIVASIIKSLELVDVWQTEIRDNLEKLQSELTTIARTIETKQHEGLHKRIFRIMEHPDMIDQLKKRVNDAVDLLKLDTAVKTEIKVDKTLKIAEGNSQHLTKAALDATRSKLQYVKGASWDSHRVCLKDTRNHVINEIRTWVDNASDSRTENILLLTGVAGAGKSTVAHTIAQHYHSSNKLVTSFFFDRETKERNNAKQLIGTIAADLCRTNEQLANYIMRAIDEDEGVASAPISRQFEELVLKPCNGFADNTPLVIVLDALDEGHDDDLLTILTQAVSKLPHSICFVVTARTFPQLEVLREQDHVQELELDIHSTESIEDVALFVEHRLKKVAAYHRLGNHWPNPKLVASFTTRAEGLFLWVATICDYLLTRSDPTSELQKLVSASHTTSVSAEAKMDKLYATILQACNWDDEAFVNDYRRLVGAAVASKAPMTLYSLGKLYQHDPVVSNLARRLLSPLLTGLGDGNSQDQPVRLLHQSFRDFVTLRASGPNASPDNQRFAIDEKAHSQTLALLCLNQMNWELKGSIPGVGYLAGVGSEAPGIPNAPESGISEELRYACRFWVDHLLNCELPLSPSMLESLKEFLGSRCISWMELTAVYGQYEGLSKLQGWEHTGELPSVSSLIFSPRQGATTRLLAERLAYMDRLEEALMAARDGEGVYRKLADTAPIETREDLARALDTLTNQLYKLGYREDALKASEEALELRRQLANEQPKRFTSELAHSIHSWSMDLRNLGRHEEALEAIEEAVTLRRQLASAQLEMFTPDLADSVHHLSLCLFSLGRIDEALEAVEEEVKLYRQLASEQPAVFTSELAHSVQTLSVYLSSLGRHEEALEATEEAVKLRRQLASERPAAFNCDLADSIHSLSIRLASFGRHEEALEAIEEAVKLHRQLASERPAVVCEKRLG